MPCGTFTYHRERIQKFKETSDVNYIYKSDINKAYFAHDAANFDSKNLTKRTVSDKMLKDRAYEIPINTKNDGYQRGLASMVYHFLIRNQGREIMSMKC